MIFLRKCIAFWQVLSHGFCLIFRWSIALRSKVWICIASKISPVPSMWSPLVQPWCIQQAPTKLIYFMRLQWGSTCIFVTPLLTLKPHSTPQILNHLPFIILEHVSKLFYLFVDNDELRIGKDVGKLPAIAGSHLGSCGLHCCSWQTNKLSFPVSSYPVSQEALYSDWL